MTKTNTTRRLQLETLEARDLKAGDLTVNFSQGILTVTGTPGADSIALRQSQGQISVTGTSTTFTATDIKEIHVFAGDGNDTIDLTGVARPSVINAGAGDDVVWGGKARDVIFGRAGNDQLHGQGGNDMLFGGKGDDALYGGDGRDFLFGGDGNDQLYGGAGHDFLFGGYGDDQLHGGDGYDLLWGGPGTDHFYHDANDLVIGSTDNQAVNEDNVLNYLSQV
jgi:Ca2+-binding RTX toxin-like protein